MKSRVWTEAEEAALRRLYSEGLDDREIAAALKRTQSSIRHRRNELGINIRNIRKWTMEENRRLREMKYDGISYRTAALVLGRSYDAVYVQWKKIKGKYF